MKLFSKVYSIWEGRSFFVNKNRLTVCLAAIGIMGGFFVVVASSIGINITSPVGGEIVKDSQTITWSASCGDGFGQALNVDSYLLANGGTTSVPLGRVACDASYTWDTSTVADGNYQIKVAASNDHDNFDTSDVFIIDNTNPVIAAGAITIPTAGATLNGGAYNITWTPENITDANLAENPISLSYSIEGGTFVPLASGLAKDGTYSWTPTGINSNSVTIKITAFDKAENSAEQVSGVFKVDSRKPVATVSVDIAAVNDAVRTKTVTVSYDEAMNTAITPEISFNSGVLKESSETGVWTDGNVWTQVFTIKDNNETKTGVTATVTESADVVGNVQEPATSATSFAIDTENPIVVVNGVVTTPSPAKAGNMAVMVAFNETMMANVIPTVKVANAYTAVALEANSWTADGKTWSGIVNIPGDAINGSAVISVEGATDANGNVMLPNATAGNVNIDTAIPTGSATISKTMINADALIQIVEVTYQEKMTVKPAITFSTDVWTEENAGEWMNIEQKIWTQSFKLTDMASGIDSLGATVTASANGAADAAGNIQMAAAVSSAFAIDTVHPQAMLSDNHADGIVRDADAVVVTATFGEAVNTPMIAVAGEAAVVMTGSGSVWTYEWNVPSGNVTGSDVIVTTTDLAGNSNAASVGQISYQIDNVIPTAGFAYDINRAVKDADSLKITTTLSEGLPTVSIIPVITITTASAGVTTGAMSPTIDGKVWTYDYAVPADNSGIATVTLSNAMDTAGNVVGTLNGNTFMIDNSLPTGSMALPVAGLYRRSVPLMFTGNDATTTFECTYRIDGGAEKDVDCTNDGTTPNAMISTPEISDGKHKIYVTITDEAESSTTLTSAEFVFTGDNVLNVGAGKEYLTIGAAIDAAQSGDTIEVSAGTYAENVVIPAAKTGLTISGNDDADTFLNVTSGVAIAVNASVTIENFTIDCLKQGADGIHFYNGNGKTITIQDNTIKGYKQEGIIVEGGTVYISRNVIIGAGEPAAYSTDSIYTKGGVAAVITGNTLSANIYETDTDHSTSAGISVHANDNVTATDNTIFGNSFGIHVKGYNTATSGETADPVVIVNNNKIYNNAVKNFYFEKFSGTPAAYDVIYNWWGSKVKTDIESKLSTDYAAYTPWYLNEDRHEYSGQDVTGPTVVLSTNEADSLLKVGETVTVNVSISDVAGTSGVASGVNSSINPSATVVSGAYSANPTMTESGSGWSFAWIVPDIEGTATISVEAQDNVGNLASANDDNEALSFVIDKTAPTFAVGAGEDGISATPVKSDDIKITITEENGISETKYGFIATGTLDSNCSAATGLTEGILSGDIFSFAIADNHSNYLCVMAKDVAGNTGYKLVGQLNTDNIAPARPTVSLTDPVMTGNVASVSITGIGEANADIIWSITDKNNVKVSGSGKVNGSGIISLIGIDVTTLADGDLILSVILKDAATNESEAGTDTVNKDTQIPTISSVSSNTADGIYTVNKDIDIDVTFSEPVKGTVNIALNASSSAACSFTLTTFETFGTCSYKVVAGDNTSHLVTTLSGLLLDASGNAMASFTPEFDKDIAIDTIAPNEYSVNIDQTIINSSNNAALSFTFAGAEIGASYLFSVDNLADTAGSIIGTSGIVTSATQQITGFDVSSLADGTLTLWFAIKDQAGNDGATISDTVSKDVTGPVFDTFADIEVPATDANGKIVTFAPTAQGADSIVCNPVSGSLFAIATTQVTCVAKDVAGNEATMSFNVIVKDETAPAIASHENVTIEATSATGAKANYVLPSANDNVDTSVAVSCSPAIDVDLPFGNTTVTCNAHDAAGNNAEETTFIATVVDTIVPTISGLIPSKDTLVSDTTPEIKADFVENGSGIDVATIKLMVDGIDQTAYAERKDASGVSYVPDNALAEGIHTVTVDVKDLKGNAAIQAAWSFKTVASKNTILITSDKTSVVANGSAIATITASLLSDGKPLADADIIFSAFGMLSATDVTTDSDGKATTTLKSTTAGQDTVVVSYGAGSSLVQDSVVITFTAVSAPTVPTATTSPLDNATGVLTTVNPVITFSTTMDEATLTDANVQLRKYSDSTAVSSAFDIKTLNNKTVLTIMPDNYLANGTQYYYFISGVTNTSGTAMTSWTTKASHEFTTVAQSISQFVIPLQEGWNLVSLPVIPTDSNIGEVLEGVADITKISSIQYYDASTKTWSSYLPDYTGNLTEMKDGRGYWINATGATTLTVYGNEWPTGGQTMPLSYSVKGKAWNLIGFKSSVSKIAGEYISQMGDDDILWVYKNGKQTSLKKTDMLETGFGYWYYTYKDGFDIIPQ